MSRYKEFIPLLSAAGFCDIPSILKLSFFCTFLDIDECVTGENNCHADYATCTNTGGNFTCSCNSGYSGDGVTCEGKIQMKLCRIVGHLISIQFFNFYTYLICLDINECETGENNCQTGYATCSNTEGGFTCACNTGYSGDGVICQGKQLSFFITYNFYIIII